MNGFNLTHLDATTRDYMMNELDSDIASGTLVCSRDFSDYGRAHYQAVIRKAIEEGDTASMERALEPKFFDPTRTDKNGRVSELNLTDSARKFAGGEFNRFYLRGLCLRAEAEGISELVVYRAKYSEKPRPESEAMIGRRLPVADLLDDLRGNKGFGTYLGVPMGPHSGLSVRFPEFNENAEP